MFVIVFDLINIFPILTEHLLLPPLGIQLQSVCLVDAHLDIIDFVGLPPRLIYLLKNSFLLKLQETDAIRKMQLVYLY